MRLCSWEQAQSPSSPQTPVSMGQPSSSSNSKETAAGKSFPLCGIYTTIWSLPGRALLQTMVNTSTSNKCSCTLLSCDLNLGRWWYFVVHWLMYSTCISVFSGAHLDFLLSAVRGGPRSWFCLSRIFSCFKCQHLQNHNSFGPQIFH